MIVIITIIIIVIIIIAARVTNSWSYLFLRDFLDHHHLLPLHHYYWHHSASFLSRSTRLITGKVCSRSSFTRLPSPRYQTPGRRIRDASIVGRKLITSSADRIRDSARDYINSQRRKAADQRIFNQVVMTTTTGNGLNERYIVR